MRSNFFDYYHLDSVSREHLGIKIISIDDFLKQKALTGELLDSSGNPFFPPGNKTHWDSQNPQPLYGYLRLVTQWLTWQPDICVAAFPKSSNPLDVVRLQKTMEEVLHDGIGQRRQYIGRPIQVNDTAKVRLKEMLVHRRKLCIYDQKLQEAPVITVINDYAQQYRVLAHFYGFLFFEDWRQDLWTKRFIRDHLRYKDEIQCASARVVRALRERARSRDPTNTDGLFDTFHIRRGDFEQQYKHVFIEIEELYQNSKDELKEGTTIYIATDERDKNLFKPLADHYDICFLDDFKHLFKDLGSNKHGILDKLVASRGNIFFGTHLSTFSSFVNRLRGYQATKNKYPGHDLGKLNSYYFFPREEKYIMREYHPIEMPFFLREFPAAWRNIDEGIDEVKSAQY